MGSLSFCPCTMCAVSYMEANGLHVHVDCPLLQGHLRPLTLPCFPSCKTVFFCCTDYATFAALFNSIQSIHYLSSWEACMQVFKVAKVMAPSVIYIDEIEKVMTHSNTIQLASAICLRMC